MTNVGMVTKEDWKQLRERLNRLNEPTHPFVQVVQFSCDGYLHARSL